MEKRRRLQNEMATPPLDYSMPGPYRKVEAAVANPEGEKECPSLPGLGIKLLRLVGPLCTSAGLQPGAWAGGLLGWLFGTAGGSWGQAVPQSLPVLGPQ